ncbi:MAG TPA: hypothetical protein PKE57_00195 [Cellvibrionaceae bacterium]|nr:hypothetical protein [Cellvibrionaceae bacterium]HMW46914.1 hypothetical protein [Cellvibrionaceae bacterium]HMW70822.1 hypothetical protein [Cellvibrionaceae bacterium]HMY37829.1 hypothetical protein [Marinagarivorans sp.]HNG59463.1 hypothetical protein [Cellvibrionaceae bacterium]
MPYFVPILPEQVFTDPRICLHFLADDANTQAGRHYLTLLDAGYFIFVIAYQTALTPLNADDPCWQGGTQIELPVSGLGPMLTALEHHYAHTRHHSLRSQAVFKYTKSVADEVLSLSRDYVLPGYALKNHTRKVHLPWAHDDWKQELRLADDLLFTQGYYAALKQLADDYA